MRTFVVCFVLVIGVLSTAHAQSRKPPKPAPGPVVKTEHGDVAIFPADNAWNQDVSKLPVRPDSDALIASIGADKPLKADFGTEWNGAPNGIPYAVVPPGAKPSKVEFEYADESDPGPYPIPADPPIEGGPNSDGDRHVLLIDPKAGKLYELYRVFKTDSGWKAGSGAIWDLTSNKLRPAGWTSADAAGLPIFPGLARYEEAVEQGAIRHALRFTASKTRRAYILPATHFASRDDDPSLPPMGLRVRLKSTVDASKAPKSVRAIVVALQTYGMILADNGSDWYVSGAPHPKWSDDDLQWLKTIRGRDFEALDTGPVVTR